jgi:hypothetical protein
MTKKGAWIFAGGKTSYALAEPGGPNVTTTRGPLEVGSVPSGAVLSSGGCLLSCSGGAWFSFACRIKCNLQGTTNKYQRSTQIDKHHKPLSIDTNSVCINNCININNYQKT